MKTFDIEVENLGPIKQGKIATSRLNIICGPNNSGKSFFLHSFYSFLDNCFSFVEIPFDDSMDVWVKTACARSIVTIPLSDLQANTNKYIQSSMSGISLALPTYLSRQRSLFHTTKMKIELNSQWLSEISREDLSINFEITSDCTCQFNKRHSDLLLTFTNTGEKFPPEKIIRENIEFAVRIALLFPFIRTVLLATSERTGAAMFADFIALPSSTERVNNQDEKAKAFLTPTDEPFSKPHKTELERLSVRALKAVFKRPGILENDADTTLHNLLHDLVRGQYRMDDHKGLRFVPDNTTVDLDMSESSSSVRTFAEIDVIVRHMLSRRSFFMIDEPEINLTPENQRRMARLLVQLTRIGIQVFITTHSDYIVREVNTLVAFHKQTDHTKRIAQKFGYAADEHIAPDDVALYYIKKSERMSPEDDNAFERIHLNGDPNVDMPPFDDSIREMADIQTELSWED